MRANQEQATNCSLQEGRQRAVERMIKDGLRVPDPSQGTALACCSTESRPAPPRPCSLPVVRLKPCPRCRISTRASP